MVKIFVAVILILDAILTLFIWVLGVGGGSPWHSAGLILLAMNISSAVAAVYFLRKDKEGYAIALALFIVPAEVLLIYSPVFPFIVDATSSARGSIRWDESVLTSAGETLRVSRTMARAADTRGNRTQTFLVGGKRLTWQPEEQLPPPIALDIVEGDPVVVVPVSGWQSCYAYAFPQEGLLAFRYRGNEWSRIALADLPSGLTVNLLRATHEIEHSSEYKNTLIDQSIKQSLEAQSSIPKQGASLAEAGKYFAGLGDSCSRLQPRPDPQLDAARALNSEAERKAPAIHARLVSVLTTPETVSAEDFVRARGDWKSAGGYMTASCKGIIDRVDATTERRGDKNSYTAQGMGYELTLAESSGERKKVAFQDLAGALVQHVICDTKRIYVVRRKSKSVLIVHRFTHAGKVVDVTRLELPDVDKILPGNEWGEIWTVTPTDKDLTIVLAAYTYPGLANGGGVIQRKQIYTAPLARK